MNRITSFFAKLLLISLCCNSAMASSLLDSISGKRIFIAHRGVDLKSTIAGENSIEAIRLAKRAGFDAIETDVRLSADDSLVVMHDATLKRTCLTADGQKISEPIPVADLTWKELQSNYKLKADAPENQSKIPSLHEYLLECRRNGLIVFIEPKKVEEAKMESFLQGIIKEADAILGRGNYIVTSNNDANDIIRDSLAIKDVPLMGILYQTTFDRINRLGNVIMAISTTRFTPDKYTENVALSRQHNLLTESHSDKFPQFNLINRNGIDVVSTDFLAPDNDSEGEILMQISDLEITPGSRLVLGQYNEPVYFGGLYLDFDIEGDAEITLGKQTFKNTDAPKGKHQVVIYNEIPQFSIAAAGDKATVKNLRLKLIKY